MLLQEVNKQRYSILYFLTNLFLFVESTGFYKEDTGEELFLLTSDVSSQYEC